MAATRRQVLAGGSALAASAAVGLNSHLSARVAAQDTVTIAWWHIFTEKPTQDAMQAAADAFTAANPNVAVEITVLENEAFKAKMTTAMQSGEAPDVFQSWGGGVLFEYGDAGLVKDLTADLAADGWGESISPAALALYGRDGKTYGVPWRMGMVGLWYNKTLLTQAGVAAPPATWADFLAAVQALKAAGVTPLTVGEGEKWPGHFYWVYLAIRLGGKAAFDAAYSREGAFTDEPFVQAGVHLQELVDLEPFQEGFLGATYADAATLMANGQAAMELMGHWSPGFLGTLTEDPAALDEVLGFAPFPTVGGGAGDPSDVLGGGDGFALAADAPPEAVAFVRYLTSPEVQADWAGKGIAVPPVVASAASEMTDPILQDIADRVSNAGYLQLFYDQFLPPAVGATVNDATQALFAGQETPEGVAGAIEESAAAEMDA